MHCVAEHAEEQYAEHEVARVGRDAVRRDGGRERGEHDPARGVPVVQRRRCGRRSRTRTRDRPRPQHCPDEHRVGSTALRASHPWAAQLTPVALTRVPGEDSAAPTVYTGRERCACPSLPNPPPVEAPRSRPAARLPLEPRLRAALLGVLAFPWFVHAAIVALSLLGAIRSPEEACRLPCCSWRARSWPCWLVPPRAITAPRVVAPPDALSGASRWAARALSGGAALAFGGGVRDCADPAGDRVRRAGVSPAGDRAVARRRTRGVGEQRRCGAQRLPARPGSGVGRARRGDRVDALGERHQLRLRRRRRGRAVGAVRGLRRAARARAQRCGVFVLAPMTLLNAPSGYVDAAFAGATVALLCTSALWLAGAQPDAWLARRDRHVRRARARAQGHRHRVRRAASRRA